MKTQSRTISLASVLMALGIILGAFGAHALKKILTPAMMTTFETGISYWYLHSIALLILGVLKINKTELKSGVVISFWLIGLALFSGGCILYAIFQLPISMLIPVGGVSFILGWISLAVQILRQ